MTGFFPVLSSSRCVFKLVLCVALGLTGCKSEKSVQPQPQLRRPVKKVAAPPRNAPPGARMLKTPLDNEVRPIAPQPTRRAQIAAAPGADYVKHVDEKRAVFLQGWWVSKSQYNVFFHAFGPPFARGRWTRNCVRLNKPDKCKSRGFALGRYGWASKQVMLFGWRRTCSLKVKLGDATGEIQQSFTDNEGSLPTSNKIHFMSRWLMRNRKKRQLAVVMAFRSRRPKQAVTWRKRCKMDSPTFPGKPYRYDVPGRGKTSRFHARSQLVILHAHSDYHGPCQIIATTGNLTRIFKFDFKQP